MKYIIVAALISFMTISEAASAKETLCLPGEKVIFSCPIKGKIVSACASEPLSSSQGSIQYRFGRKDALELSVSDDSRQFIEGNKSLSPGGSGDFFCASSVGDTGTFCMSGGLIRST